MVCNNTHANKQQNEGVLTAVLMKISVLWNITPISTMKDI
jgi:hypothetical protein